MDRMKYFSAFTGVGGFDIALNKLNLECVGHSEIDKYASMVLKYHFPLIKNYGDITTIREHELPDFDLFAGGFPCQAFSVAGKRRGFEDTRGTLFFDICRIIKHKRPRYLLLENVKGLLNHEGGETFHTILKYLDELGYDVIWQVCNAKDFGVPQNRERVFIIGYLRGECRPKVFYISRDSQENICTNKTQTFNCIDSNYWKGVDNHGQRTLVQVGNIDKKGHNSLWGRVYDPDFIAPTLNANGGGMGAKTGLYKVKRQPLKFLDRNQKNIEGDYAFTVDTVNSGGVNIDGDIRRLTPKECERLMSWPDDWTVYGMDNQGNVLSSISDSQRYKMCGNGVVSNVVYEIAKNIFNNGSK